MHKTVAGVLFVLGATAFMLASFDEWQVSHSQPVALTSGTETLLSLKASELEMAISAASWRVFAGLCVVAAAILLAAAGKKADKEPPPPKAGQATDG